MSKMPRTSSTTVRVGVSTIWLVAGLLVMAPLFGAAQDGETSTPIDAPEVEGVAMESAHFLIDHHQKLQRTVEEIPDGVKTRTIAVDPELVEPLRQHVRQMADMLHEGGRIRNWDPLFREIFDHRQAIGIEIREIERGVEVIETSDDKAVVALIRAHARKVEQFVARGWEAYREETPLPDDYVELRR